MTLHPARRLAPLLLAVVAGVAVAACDAKPPKTSADATPDSIQRRAPDSVGVIDQSPAAVANAVSASLSDENILAQLDTSYGLVLAAERYVGTNSTNAALKATAAKAYAENTTARQGVANLATQLQITRTLPDRDQVDEYTKRYQELTTKRGAAFDSAYGTYGINLRQSMVDDIDKAVRGKLRPEVLQLVVQLRRSLLADLGKNAMSRDNG